MGIAGMEETPYLCTPKTISETKIDIIIIIKRK